MAEINIEIDGVYCPRCNDLHPTLLWHERYDNYAKAEIRLAEWQRARAERSLLFGDCDPPAVSSACFGVVENDRKAPCVMCGVTTCFTDEESGERVCCAECRAALIYSESFISRE